MANTKSSRKRARQNDKRRARNSAAKAQVKSQLKGHIVNLSESKSKDDKVKAFSLIQSLIHKASKRGLFPSLRLDRKLGKIAKKYL